MKSNNNKIYVILSVFALISIFLAIFLVFPLIKEIKKNSDDLVFSKASMVSLSAQTIETEKFKKDYIRYKVNLDKIDQLFVDAKNPVEFIKFLENTAYNSQVTSKISLPPVSATSSQFILLQLSSKGSFTSIFDLVEKIETGPYLIEIGNLTIKESQVDSASKDTLSEKFDATFTIKAFIKK